MTLTFFTNYINHHQVFLADELYKRLGDNYHLVAYDPLSECFVRTGYPDYSDRPYLVKRYAGGTELNKATELEESSDVAILGMMQCPFLHKRIAHKNKISFYYNERWFKTGKWHIFDPRVFSWIYHNHIKMRNEKVYMLCASAFTAADAHLAFSYPDKCYKWGYFPDVKIYDNVDSLLKHKDANTIVWCARFIDWKHPEIPIHVARSLRDKGMKFTIEMIGGGEMQSEIVNQIKQHCLDEYVHVLGNMPTTEVRKHMEKAGIFMFTSDENEGWGAVLNEAMNSGCAIVANSRIGSVPYLLEDKENGYIYKNIKQLTEIIAQLLNNKYQQMNVGKQAYLTMKDMWNASTAAERIIKLSESLLYGDKNTPYKDGPCSKAEVLTDKWYK